MKSPRNPMREIGLRERGAIAWIMARSRMTLIEEAIREQAMSADERFAFLAYFGLENRGPDPIKKR